MKNYWKNTDIRTLVMDWTKLFGFDRRHIYYTVEMHRRKQIVHLYDPVAGHFEAAKILQLNCMAKQYRKDHDLEPVKIKIHKVLRIK